MASGGSSAIPKDASGSSNVSVVLRVKRKREEDPLDALGINMTGNITDQNTFIMLFINKYLLLSVGRTQKGIGMCLPKAICKNK